MVVARALRRLAPDLGDVPLPGSGATAERFGLLHRLAASSPALARLVEGHLDALAILAELGGSAPPGALLGVWAAEPRGRVVRGTRRPDGGLQLEGEKPFASGAGTLTHALVTVRCREERVLVMVPRAGWRAQPGTWRAVGMAGSDSPDVSISWSAAAEDQIGPSGAYLDRPGFWHGGVGVAAAWLGGAEGVNDALARAIETGLSSPHALAHLGGTVVALGAARSVLAAAAQEIDDDPEDASGTAELRARVARAVVERAASETLDRVGRALGATPLCHDGAHARRVADLGVYLRQSHAEHDLEAIGRVAVLRP